MRLISNTSPFLFDTDCICSFLWAKRMDILYQMHKDQIYIPSQVEDELNNLRRFSNYQWVPELLESEIRAGRVHKFDIVVGTSESNEFLQLTSPAGGQKPLGKGEAAIVSWAKFHGGTVASNNLSDVQRYCSNNGIGLISTDDILCAAHNRGIITLQEGSSIWAVMKARRRKLPSYDFTESYRRYINNLPKKN